MKDVVACLISTGSLYLPSSSVTHLFHAAHFSCAFWTCERLQEDFTYKAIKAAHVRRESGSRITARRVGCGGGTQTSIRDGPGWRQIISRTEAGSVKAWSYHRESTTTGVKFRITERGKVLLNSKLWQHSVGLDRTNGSISWGCDQLNPDKKDRSIKHGCVVSFSDNTNAPFVTPFVSRAHPTTVLQH